MESAIQFIGYGCGLVRCVDRPFNSRINGNISPSRTYLVALCVEATLASSKDIVFIVEPTRRIRQEQRAALCPFLVSILWVVPLLE